MKFVVILLFLTSLVFSEDKIFALLKPIQGNSQLPSVILTQLQKIGIQYVATKKEFILLLGGAEAPSSAVVDVISIESEITKNNNVFDIEIRIFDLKRKIILNSAILKNIREEDLLRMYRSAIEKVFTERVIVSPEKNSPPGQTPKVIPPPIKPSTPPATTPEVQTSTPNTEQIDFKKILQGLKSEIAVSLKKESEKNSEKKSKDEEKKKQNTIQANELTPQEPSPDQIVEKKEAEKEGLPFLPRQYLLEVGYQSRAQENRDLIITKASAKFLTFRAQITQPLRIFRQKFGLEFPIYFYRALSTPADLPIQYLIGAKIYYQLQPIKPSLSLERENSFFFNVTNAGAGLKAASIETVWLKAAAEYQHKKKVNLKVFGELGTPFMVKTGYQPVKNATNWSGLSTKLKITSPLLDTGWESSIMYETTKLETTGVRLFSLTETRFSILFGRSL